MLILTGVYEKLKFKENNQEFLLNPNDLGKFRTHMYHTIWRLFLVSGKLMFFTTINNIFYYQKTKNPFSLLEKPLCSGKCKAQNLEHLNEDNEFPFTFCCPYYEIKNKLDEILDERTKLEIQKLEKMVFGTAKLGSETGFPVGFFNILNYFVFLSISVKYD